MVTESKAPSMPMVRYPETVMDRVKVARDDISAKGRLKRLLTLLLRTGNMTKQATDVVTNTNPCQDVSNLDAKHTAENTVAFVDKAFAA